MGQRHCISKESGEEASDGVCCKHYQPLKEEAHGGGTLLQTVLCPVSTNYHLGAGICKGGIVSHSFSLTISLHLDELYKNLQITQLLRTLPYPS